MFQIAYLAFGTNLGDREGNIQRAYSLVEDRVGRIVRRSSLYHTAPWGFESDNDFINTVISVDTALTPRQLLDATQQIEREMGRTAKSHDGVYHDRIIDIDILLYGDITVDEPDLKIPHPLMSEREFVMNPLNEIKTPVVNMSQAIKIPN